MSGYLFLMWLCLRLLTGHLSLDIATTPNLHDNCFHLSISYERWLICRNEDASKKIVATGILVFDFELFIGVRCDLLGSK